MKDLRLRLGFILALALLPLLLFSIWRSYDDYQQDTKIREQYTELAARIAVSDIVDNLSNSRAVLKLSSTLISQENCVHDMKRIAQEYPRFHNIIQADAKGEIVCAARAVRDDGTKTALIASIPTSEDPFRTQISSFPAEDGRPQKVLVTAFGVFKNGSLDRVFAATEDIKFLEQLINRTEPAEGDEIAVFNQYGELLVGEWSSVNLQDFAKSRPSKTFSDAFRGIDSTGRQVSVTPTNDSHIFVAVATEKQSLMTWNKFNPLSSAMLPLVAWLFGFAAIWLSTEQLILIHLRRMRKATLGFAEGDRDMRVGTLKNPPASIYALGKNFDIMADRIEEREATISKALKEKETLLREIHHRVKNNLQIIISLLNMQERKLKTQEGLAAIVETRSRINAIALVHRGLYESENLRYVDMQIFLDRLVPELSVAFSTKKRGIKVSTTADCDLIEADSATPIALFIVEAMTNSVKHGLHRGGEVSIEITQKENLVEVRVTDIGQPKKSKVQVSNGTGAKLMKGFARQLGGKLITRNDETGYSVALIFTPRKSN